MLMLREFSGGFAHMRKYHGQSTLLGKSHFDRMIAIHQCRRHAEGWRNSVRRKQPAQQQQHMNQPS